MLPMAGTAVDDAHARRIAIIGVGIDVGEHQQHVTEADLRPGCRAGADSAVQIGKYIIAS